MGTPAFNDESSKAPVSGMLGSLPGSFGPEFLTRRTLVSDEAIYRP